MFMKLFVTDYDGTLFVDEKQIKKTNKLLKKLKEQDYIIVIATGRSYPSIKNQTNTYNILYDYLCCADGSIIFDNNGNAIKKYCMDHAIIKPFKEYYQKLNYEEIQFSYPEGYSNLLNDNGELLGINICINTQNYTKEIENSFIELSKHYPNYSFLNYKHPINSFLCVKPKGISKSSSIGYLRDILNITNDNIYVIGDSYNDYEMIRDYHGYAINSFCDEVKEVAKKLYPNIDEYIKELLKED